MIECDCLGCEYFIVLINSLNFILFFFNVIIFNIIYKIFLFNNNCVLMREKTLLYSYNDFFFFNNIKYF